MQQPVEPVLPRKLLVLSLATGLGRKVPELVRRCAPLQRLRRRRQLLLRDLDVFVLREGWGSLWMRLLWVDRFARRRRVCLILLVLRR